MNLTGSLMCGDTVVALFDGAAVTPIVRGLVPLCFRDGGDFIWWLESRAIDRHRTHSRLLKKVLRLKDTSDVATVLHSHASTVTDNYWVRLDGETLRWDDVRITSDHLAALALSGDADSLTKAYPAVPTPELTNIGSFEKCWVRRDDTWALVKVGTPAEVFSEVFTYYLGTALNFHMAVYFAGDGHVMSPDFTRGRYNFEPIANLVYDDEDLVRSYDALESLKRGLGKQFLDILYMDILVFNPDRHTYNYGVLRDKYSGEILSMAPNYDNNMALISRGTPSKTLLLIEEFVELLSAKHITYTPPLTKEVLDDVVRSTMPEAAVDRQFIRKFVWENNVALSHELQKRGGS